MLGVRLATAFSNMDASNAFESVNIFDPNNPLTAPLGSVSTWSALGRKDVRAASYGGFVGYNTQWDDAIIGIDLNYNHSSLFGSWSSSRCYDETNLACFGAITLGDGNAYNVTVVATTSARITDYGTLRGRGAWVYRQPLALRDLRAVVGPRARGGRKRGHRRCDAAASSLGVAVCSHYRA